MFDSKFKDFKAKFTTHWLGSYEIEEIFNNGVVKTKTIDKASISFVVNGNRLKIYHKPVDKEYFLRKISMDSDLEIVGQHSNMPSKIPVVEEYKKDKNK